jgi:hypothetical protein
MRKSKKAIYFTIPLLFFLLMFFPIIKTQNPTCVNSFEKVDKIDKQDRDRLSSEFGEELEFGHFQNDLISKRLPKLKFFSTNNPRMLSRTVYLINSDGTSANYYPEQWMEGGENSGMYYNQKYSDFLVAQDLHIHNQQDAIEMVVLLGTIASYQYQYPNVRIRVPKQHISLFRFLLNRLTGEWYYWAEQTETGWQAGLQFRRGLMPVSINRPPLYIIELDDNNKVTDLFKGMRKLPAKEPKEL